jgi:hypothetical protein
MEILIQVLNWQFITLWWGSPSVCRVSAIANYGSLAELFGEALGASPVDHAWAVVVAAVDHQLAD